MSKIKTGCAKMPLSSPDPGGNYGYYITFNFEVDLDNPTNSFKISDIEFSGPGSFGDYSEGDDYPTEDMRVHVLNLFRAN